MSETRTEIIPSIRPSEFSVPAIIAAAGDKASEHFLEFFAATIRRRDAARCGAAGLSEEFCNHTFRGTGIMVFLHNGGSLEAAQDMASHSDPRTTKLYDRRKDLATLGEIERRIAFE